MKRPFKKQEFRNDSCVLHGHPLNWTVEGCKHFKANWVAPRPAPAPAPALGIAAIKLSCYPRTKKQLIYRNNEGIEPVGAAACVEQMHNWNVIWVCDS